MEIAENNNGPNQILHSTNMYTSDIQESVCLKIPKTGNSIETIPPISVPHLLNHTATLYPNQHALAYKSASGKWEKMTYREYEEQVKICAKAFLHLGLKSQHGVCILGFNSPEWFISSLAAIYAGGISVGIYTTNSSSACLHCAEQGKADIIVVQDDKQLAKIMETKNKLPFLKAIIQYEGIPTTPGVLSWKNLMEIGKQQANDKLNNALKQIAINRCCMLVFTSGTIGNPKAVMISHDNIIWNAQAISEHIMSRRCEDHVISYLPLSHIAAQLLDIYISINIAGTVYFADKDALKGSLINTMVEVRPTYFLGVPRIWEKIYEKMNKIAIQSGSLKKVIASWAKKEALIHNLNKMNGHEFNTWTYKFTHWLIFKRIKNALGLNRCKLSVSAAAPLSSDIKKYFLSIDLPIMEVYGMSESTGAHTLSLLNRFGLDSVGPTISGMKTKIVQADEQHRGEICLYGRHICMGYLNDPKQTKETIDEEGWLHSGDIGYVDKDGLLSITGRIKELLITSGGENVPPVPIEEAVKNELPHLSNVMLIGDKQKFLSMLISLKTEVDLNMFPLDKLTPEVQNWLEHLGCSATTVTEVLNAGPDDKLLNAIQDKINNVNQNATSNAQRIQKFKILPRDFSVPTGELGPTMKVKRNVVLSKYEDIIEKLYL